MTVSTTVRLDAVTRSRVEAVREKMRRSFPHASPSLGDAVRAVIDAGLVALDVTSDQKAGRDG